MSSFGKLVSCHIIQSLPTALDPHQFAYGANRWTLPLRLSGLLGATNSSRRGWVLLILVRLSKQPSPTDWSPNWQSWASLHPSAAGSWTSCQNPSQRVGSSAPPPTPPYPSASIQTFSSRKKVQQRPSFVRLRDSGRSPSNRNCSRLVSTATECGLVCGFFMPAGGRHLHPENRWMPSSPPMNFIAPTASEKPKTSRGTPS